MGKKNTGKENSGNWNSGSCNSGDRNSGYHNSGNYNSGYSNSGNSNSGDRNSGNWNFGYSNSGHYNSGNYNSGHYNSGHHNSGDCNSTIRESGMFCTKEGTVRCFNKDSGKRWEEIDCPHYREFHLTKWIDKTTGGYIKEYTYKEAWANFWRDTDEKNRQKFLNLPNFDADIFFEITGIDVNVRKKDIKEMTVEEISEKLGYEVKVIKK